MTRTEAYPQIFFPGPSPAFTPVAPEIRDRILGLPPERQTLQWAEGMVEALREVEMHNPSFSAPPPPTIRVAAWNLQQCHFPRASADVLAAANIDIALLSEIDIGLYRTGQHHTLALLSEHLTKKTGIPRGFGAGVEFFELKAVDNPIHPTGKIGDNQQGFHANGWLTRFKARRPALIRLGPEADWFVKPRGDQRRIGGRMAAAAIFELGKFDIVGAATHLESDTDSAGRRRQMRQLLDGLDDFAGKRPVILGGDFNTGAREPDFDYRKEGLFKEAERRGYEWRRANSEAPTSRPSGVANAARQDRARYDWFFIKGLAARNPAVIPALDGEGRAISDHDAVAIEIDIPKNAIR